SQGPSSSNVSMWVALLRAGLAVGLGLALLFYPDKSRNTLLNILAIFWILAGAVSLLWDAHGKRPGRPSMTTSLILIGVGLLVLVLIRMGTGVGEVVLIWLLALVMMVTGAVHLTLGMRTRRHPTRQWSAFSFGLGIFEVLLGALLLFAPLNWGPWLFTAAGIWAFAGAAMLMLDAYAQRSLTKTN
ncbi:MAG: DUF308 domain-containing protein, partial [Caldilineaceae bacterium]